MTLYHGGMTSRERRSDPALERRRVHARGHKPPLGRPVKFGTERLGDVLLEVGTIEPGADDIRRRLLRRANGLRRGVCGRERRRLNAVVLLEIIRAPLLRERWISSKVWMLVK